MRGSPLHRSPLPPLCVVGLLANEHTHNSLAKKKIEEILNKYLKQTTTLTATKGWLLKDPKGQLLPISAVFTSKKETESIIVLFSGNKGVTIKAKVV